MKRVGAKVIILAIAAVLLLSFSNLSVFASEEKIEQDSFTAVAGTEHVVTDRRQKNNITVVSGLVFAMLALLAAGALSHARSKKASAD